jgi:two-component system sensor histidine kinase KdpD
MQLYTSDGRPNPEDILQRIAKTSLGKLTVFLGAAAGVGKTYAMLEMAHIHLKEGIDVIIGFVETHGRKETENLVEGLPYIPAKTIEYRGKTLAEMDIDGIIARKPELVLVDELAHSNVPSSRHKRRFQDVGELIRNGINVYTTLNIQHIESLNDVVNQLTGIVVQETVPDFIVEQANAVKLIDIPPNDLIQRLKDGKVYKPSQAKQALLNFFRLENINGLRELALRFTANQVEKDLKECRRDDTASIQCPIAGRVMVCVGPSPFSVQLIRAAYRLAGGLQADWLAVHIELTRSSPLSNKDRERLDSNIQLATELGAKMITVVGEDLTKEILALARLHNISTIVIGKPRHSRLWEIIRGSIVDELIRKSGETNVHVIRGEAEQKQTTAIVTAPPSKPKQLLQYIGGILMMLAVTGISSLLKNKLGIANIAVLYQLPVVLCAYWWGRWPSYLTAFCSVIVCYLLFETPSVHFQIDQLYHLWSFIVFLIVAFVIGGRTQRQKMETALARIREKSTRTLHQFSLEIATVHSLKAVTQVIARQTANATDRNTRVLLPDSHGMLTVWAEYNMQIKQGRQPIIKEHLPLDDIKEAEVAEWAYQHEQAAGNSTQTSLEANYLYIPLKAPSKIVGILGIRIGEHKLMPEERRLIDAGVGLAAIAIERTLLATIGGSPIKRAFRTLCVKNENYV